MFSSSFGLYSLYLNARPHSPHFISPANKKWRYIALKKCENFVLQSKVWVDNKDFNNLVFLTKNGNPVGNSTLNLSIIRIVTNINNDAKIEAKLNEIDYIEFKHMYMHSLRHTYATRCIENNMKPKRLQKILGHSSISITMNLYVHVTDDELANEVQRSSPQLIKENGVKMA